MTEKLLVGWQAIANYLGCSERTARRKAHELKRSGVVFYQWLGTPPQKRVCAWPIMIRSWTSVKTRQNEIC